MKVVIAQGETLNVFLEDTDSEFEISYGGKHPDILTVQTELPDSLGREGFIYAECFNPLQLLDGEDAEMRLFKEAARRQAIDLMSDEEILALYNTFESAAQSRGILGG